MSIKAIIIMIKKSNVNVSLYCDGVSRWVAEGEQQFVFSRVQGSGQDGVDGPAEDHTGDKQGELLGCCLHSVHCITNTCSLVPAGPGPLRRA